MIAQKKITLLMRWRSPRWGEYFLVKQTGNEQQSPGFGIWRDPAPDHPSSGISEIHRWEFFDEAQAAFLFAKENNASPAQIHAFPERPIEVDGVFARRAAKHYCKRRRRAR
jgi:hypothetical protein